MPMYEYQCGKCGHIWELIQKMSDSAPKSCPDCRGRKVGKVLSQTSFVLKGSGWYADGYAGGSNQKPGAASKKSSDSSSSSSSPSATSSKDSSSSSGSSSSASSPSSD